MRRPLTLAASALLAAVPAVAQEMSVPSGQMVTLQEVLLDDAPGELWVRFRFLAPEITRDGGSVASYAASADMEYLCQDLAVPYLDNHDIEPARVVISLADRPVEFGASDPEATQFFEAYRLEDARCIWEGL